jgi:hypothetical protein
MIYQRIGKALVCVSFGLFDLTSPRDLVECVVDTKRTPRQRLYLKMIEMARTRFGVDRCFCFALNLFGYRLAILFRTDPEAGLKYSMDFVPGYSDPENVARRERYRAAIAAEEAEVARLVPNDEPLVGRDA